MIYHSKNGKTEAGWIEEHSQHMQQIQTNKQTISYNYWKLDCIRIETLPTSLKRCPELEKKPLIVELREIRLNI